ncbi:MAG: hypothetical protein DME59_04455 [Verrucomicrobia bacterium]|nr:MAG: hypothetical protein DME59_04455 [Verrucomicrobiota bacterium]
MNQEKGKARNGIQASCVPAFLIKSAEKWGYSTARLGGKSTRRNSFRIVSNLIKTTPLYRSCLMIKHLHKEPA